MSQAVNWVAGIFLLLFLGINTYMDFKRREICMWSIGPALAAGIGLNVYHCIQLGEAGPKRILFILAGLLPGLLVMVFSKLLKGTIGFGDGILITILGLFFSIYKLPLLLLWSGFAAGGAALFCLLLLKKGRKYELPFVPFLAFGSLVEFLIGGIL